MLRLLGLGLLAFWASFWIQSFAADFQFAGMDWTWIPAWNYLGLDYLHCHLGVRAWAAGHNPYLVDIGDFRGVGEAAGRYAAPPITLPLFAWTRFFDPYVGVILWTAAIAGVMAYAVVLCVRTRRMLGLWAPPLPLALAVILWSMPVLFSMERGNLDVWVLITLFAALPLLRRGGWAMEAPAGLVLAVGAWAKIYPGLFILALLPFGKWRAALACLAGIVLIGLVPLDLTRQFFRNASQLDDNRVASIQEVADWLKQPTLGPYRGSLRVDRYSHSLTTYWPLLFGQTPLGAVPGFLGAAAILGPLFLYVAWEVWRSRRREKLFLPFVLWTLALGTYGLPISHDYNLFFLLLTALALWDTRDPIVVHVLMLSAVVWWQPLELPFVGVALFLYLQFLAILPVSILLVLRAREQEPVLPAARGASEAPVATDVPASPMLLQPEGRAT